MQAAIYARKSTDQSGVADEAKSVTRQIEHATAYAQQKGWTVADAHVYVDDGISGAEFAKRPGFLRLMNALKPRPPFDVLIMSEESRLGREQIETAYALKQITTSGVRVFYYLDDRERTLDSPTDKIMQSLTAFADELEREKARQRVHDAMTRKARAGHVTGGRCFGYDNVRIDGHVERRINEKEAAVIRRIFALCAAGTGYTKIAKVLNAEGALSPRPQQGRPAGWAPSSVKEVIDRRLYVGEVTWNKTRKRNQWGQHQSSDRPESEWLRRSMPELRIVSDAAWNTAHARLDGIRKRLRDVRGDAGYRRDVESKYLLSGFARCAVCGASFYPLSRSHGRQRAFFYGCSAHHKRGSTVCENNVVQRMETIDDAVLKVIGGDVLRPAVIMAVIDAVVAELKPQAFKRTVDRQRKALRDVEREIGNLTKAIAAGGPLDSLVTELKSSEGRRAELVASIESAEAVDVRRLDRKGIERTVRQQLTAWRSLLTTNVGDGRQLLREVLVGPLRFTPEGKRYRFEGEAAIGRLLAGSADLAPFMASPTGTALLWKPEISGKAKIAA